MPTKHTTAEHLNRIAYLCDLLQSYPESAARLTESKRALEGAQNLYFASGSSSDNRAAQIAKWREMVEISGAACQQWLPFLNEFFSLTTLNKLNILQPTFNATRAAKRMPHTLESFDWPAFSVELLSVRDEALRHISAEAVTTTVEPQLTPSAPVEMLDRLAVLIGDSGGKMLHVISDKKLSTDQKLRAMERIDKPSMASITSSEKLGSVLGVTGSAVRATDWWIKRQKRPQE